MSIRSTIIAGLLAIALPISGFAASTNLNDGHTVVVAAHSDDEILWMDPVIGNAMEVVIVGHSVAASQANAIEYNLQDAKFYNNRSIPITYAFPVVTDQQRIDEVANTCYRDLELYDLQATWDALWPVLWDAKGRGMTRVVTHNPWGEYGHPHHRLLSDIVRWMAWYLDIDVWYDSVVKTKGGKTLAQGAQYLDAQFLSGVTYSSAFSWGMGYWKSRWHYVNNYLTVSPFSSLWTWDFNTDGFPAGSNRKFWRAVVDGHDLTIQSPWILYNQIRRIKGEIAYDMNDPLKVYFVPPFYTCASSSSQPVYFPH